MTVETFKGRITPFNQPDILKFLQESGKTGLLRAENGPVTKGLYVRRGRVIAAESTLASDSLLSLLRETGRLGAEQAAAAEMLVNEGLRPGRALVQTGAVSPADLWTWTERRVRAIARSILSWETGTFAFEEGTFPADDWMVVDLDILDLLLGALRDLGEGELLASRAPDPEAPLEHVSFSEGGEAPPLLPHEKYVLGLVNGRRTPAEISRLCELGDAATRKILAMLFLVGCTRPRRAETAEGAPVPSEDSLGDVKAVVRAYNEMFSFLYGYMIKEVGPIAEHVIEKYLREVRESNQTLFSRIALGKDGTLSEEALSRNLSLVRGKNRREVLIGGLNEFLYSGLLAVKRTLGADHEEIVVRRLKEIRKSPAPLG